MKIIILIHTASETAGSLGEYLKEIGVDAQIIRLDKGDRIPPLGAFDAVISMGGTMNVYEEDKFPFLKDETEFLKEAIYKDTPIVGVCLGGQMIAKAAGATVVKSPTKEVGWYPVALTAKGRRDLLFDGLPESLEVFQYHEDMFNLPEGAELLAKSEGCPHQAFRLRNAFALQFHVEVTPDMLKEWFSNSEGLKTMLEGYDQRASSLVPRARAMYDNWLGLIKDVKARL
jgi:GMP synthase (glutamine-hydrolysing)